MNISGINKRILKIIENYCYGKKIVFAQKSGISPGAVSNYVKGTRVPQAEELMKICKTFRISSDWLLFGEENQIESGNDILLNEESSESENTDLVFSLNRQIELYEKLISLYIDRINRLEKEVSEIKTKY